MKDINVEKTVVIGAGITGLIIGQELKLAGQDALIIDKGRQSGGRICTRIVDGQPVEIGPEWLTISSEDLSYELVARLQESGANEVEFDTLTSLARRFIPTEQLVRAFHVPGGLRQWTGKLAEGLRVRQSVHLRSINKKDHTWQLVMTDSAGGGAEILMETEQLVLTIPCPQIVELFANSGLDIVSSEQLVQLTEVCYDRKIVSIFKSDNELEGDFAVSWVKEFGAGSSVVGQIRHLRDERGGSILKILSNPRWSVDVWDQPNELISKQLGEEAKRLLDCSMKWDLAHFHRWKYATLAESSRSFERPMFVSVKPDLLLAGEAFGVSTCRTAGLFSSIHSAKFAVEYLKTR